MSTAGPRDLKKAISLFIQHVESLENAENPDKNGFEKEYKLIQDEQIQNRKENIFPMEAGKTENNLKKNRYKDILPYDEHRVKLKIVNEDTDSDYINASKIKGVKGTEGYIATQGPLASTVTDFWRMVWECKVEIIFMACRIVEMGKIKCKQYWNDQGKSDQFGDITVFTELEDSIMSDCIRRTFRVAKGEEVREVIQFHYSGWPDHGIPDDAGHIRDMIGYVRKSRHNDRAPLLVHCSAGCGRTGAIIAIDYVWTLLEEGKFEDNFSLFDLICKFRQQRMSIVQTTDQYALVNKVLKSLCEEWLKKVATHTYENVQVDQASEYSRTDPSNKKDADYPYDNAESAVKEGQINSEQNLTNEHVGSPHQPHSPSSVFSSPLEKNTKGGAQQKADSTQPAIVQKAVHKTVIKVSSGQTQPTSDLNGRETKTPLEDADRDFQNGKADKFRLPPTLPQTSQNTDHICQHDTRLTSIGSQQDPAKKQNLKLMTELSDEISKYRKKSIEEYAEVKKDRKTSFEEYAEVKKDRKTLFEEYAEVKKDRKTSFEEYAEVKKDRKTSFEDYAEVKKDRKTSFEEYSEVWKSMSVPTHEYAEARTDRKISNDEYSEPWKDIIMMPPQSSEYSKLGHKKFLPKNVYNDLNTDKSLSTDTYATVRKDVSPRPDAATCDNSQHTKTPAGFGEYAEVNVVELRLPKSPIKNVGSKLPTNPACEYSEIGDVSPLMSSQETFKKKLKAPEPPPTPVKPQQSSSSSSTETSFTAAHTGREHEYSSYEYFDFPKDGSGSDASAHSHVGSGNAAYRKQIFSCSPPGFKDRLPRVRGPVPMPAAWGK